jgi:hypothetical protein
MIFFKSTAYPNGSRIYVLIQWAKPDPLHLDPLEKYVLKLMLMRLRMMTKEKKAWEL